MNDLPAKDPGEDARVHRSDCFHWTLPAPDPELALALGTEDESVLAYARQARPVYEHLKRVLGQLAGLLILCQTAPARADRDQPLVTSAREQLEETRAAWHALRPPHATRRHHAALGRILEQLESVRGTLRRRIDLVDAESGDLDRALRQLFAAHSLLLACSDDRAGMTPVDFSHACCSCGAAAKAVPVDTEPPGGASNSA